MSNKGGLEGIVVADVQTSKVDGENGKLIYAGYSIEDLAAHSSFEEVFFLLHNTRLPNASELEEVRSQIASQAVVPDPVLDMMKVLPKSTPAMAVVRTATSMLSAYDPDAENLTDKDVARTKAIRLTGQVTTICAAWVRISKGLEPVAPRSDLGLAANFMYMMTGEEPDETASAAVDVYLVLLAEHGMNASTFASRVITATGSDMHSAVVGAIGALKGPSHGGANAEAMKMFLEIGEPENVAGWFKTNIKEGDRRIMGIGHRVYKAPDPRAAVLKEHGERLADSSGNSKWFDIAVKLEEAARADEYFIERKLFPNVDYYSAIVLYTLNLDIDMFTPLFVMSRMAGWTAHIVDQMQGRLIRPKANYIGPFDLTWKPVNER
ncbi:MAG: citrate/2-methylcitrate synthase [Anaerolineae bacterium]|nr:citrate/2-methylcitrate synthase [Anaerolineae bacterium]MCA9895050.1 citrate/2-methylcitrate synthase [Anaerolineae bacterium]